MESTALICTHCGFNTVTGKTMRTRVLKPEKEPENDGREKRRRSNPLFYHAMSAVGGVVAGGIGAFIWAAFIRSSHVEIGWMATIIGVLTGFGAYLGAQGFANILTGVWAVFLAFAAIFVGRYMGVKDIIAEMYNVQIGGFFDVLPYLFQPWDVLWCLLAALGAFRVASSGLNVNG